MVIGIDEDGGHRSPLANACNDARVMAELLRKDGFDPVATFYDSAATYAAVMTYLSTELPQQVRPDDRVVIFFAGHGITQTGPDGRQHGYLVLYNSSQDGDYIDMAALRQVCSGIPAKHILLLLDCCFSGLGAADAATFTSGPATVDPRPKDEFLRAITQRRAWQVLTSGDVNEVVADNSIEAGHSAFMAAYVRWQIVQESALRGLVQTPLFAYLSEDKHGDFVFEVSRNPVPPPAGSASAAGRAPRWLIALLLLGALIYFLFGLVAIIFSHIPIRVNQLDPNSAMTTPEMAQLTAVTLMVVALGLASTAYILWPAWQAATGRQCRRSLRRLGQVLRRIRR